MSGLKIWLIALGLAMDCFAVSIASGIILKKTVWRTMFTMALLFGLFQGGMPLLGWLLAHSFSQYITQIDHWIAFGILMILGIKMIYESFKHEEEKSFDPSKLKVILTLAVATSIDAMAIGVSFSCLGIDSIKEMMMPSLIIGFVSFVMSILGLLIGIKFGNRFAKKIHAEFWGGIILIIIGIKILTEHLS